TLYAIASRLARDGKWIEAREVFGLLIFHHPAHPLAVESYRWLIRCHAGTETRRRTEIQQKVLLKQLAFETAGGVNKSAPGSGITQAAQPVVNEDEYKFYSPNAIQQWHQGCLNLEPRLATFGPVYSRDPAAWLCFGAARRQVGKHAEAGTLVSDYFKSAPGAADAAPGADPWRDCLAAELWLLNPSAVPIQPKPLAHCKKADARPLLDGKLDDACWKSAKVMPLKALTAPTDRADDLKAFGAQYQTEALFCYDERYLYVGVTCAHPAGKKVEPVAKRTRDADLSGHDRVDILLDLDRDYQTYYRFQIDHRGCLAEDCWGDKSWNPKYHVAFHSTDAGWTAEIAIPLVELTGDRPTHGRTWAANVSRVVPGVGVQAWSGPADHDPRPEGMGLLQFRADK
ncbi:MAG: hypothetical protein K2V38_05865, partial [Gemmataceae bacterium]|nr:hypothetical protein [Gemmataceae bacterium]